MPTPLHTQGFETAGTPAGWTLGASMATTDSAAYEGDRSLTRTVSGSAGYAICDTAVPDNGDRVRATLHAYFGGEAGSYGDVGIALRNSSPTAIGNAWVFSMRRSGGVGWSRLGSSAVSLIGTTGQLDVEEGWYELDYAIAGTQHFGSVRRLSDGKWLAADRASWQDTPADVLFGLAANPNAQYPTGAYSGVRVYGPSAPRLYAADEFNLYHPDPVGIRGVWAEPLEGSGAVRLLALVPAHASGVSLAYQWHHSDDPDFTPGESTAISGATTLVYSASGLPGGTTGYFRLGASDGSNWYYSDPVAAEIPEDTSAADAGVVSTTVPAGGLAVVLAFEGPVGPASGIEGFALSVAGSPRSATVARTAAAEITLTPASPIYAGQAVLVAYEPGNLTDGSGAVPAFTATAVNGSALPPPETVVWRWSGAVAANSATVAARLSGPCAARLRVYDAAGESLIASSDPATADASNNSTVKLAVSGLAPDTPYLARVESNGAEDASKPALFRTAPAAGQPADDVVAFASCHTAGSTANTFARVVARSPKIFLMTGDFHYSDISVNDINLYRSAYASTFSGASPTLYAAVASDYVWDDHDFGANNSSSDSPSKAAAAAAYREMTPHYPLPDPGNTAIYHAFTRGRIRFLVTDNRSERTPYQQEDSPSKRVFSEAQEDWFFAQAASALSAGMVVAWVNTFPWIGDDGDDGWHRYAYHRAAFADRMKAAGLAGKVFSVNGDAHMIAADDGTNSDYATGGGMPFPVLHAAAMDRTGSVKGGPYSHGAFGGSGQYGVLTIADDGGSEINLAFRGYLPDDTVGVSLDFTLAPASQPDPDPLIAGTLSTTGHAQDSASLAWTDATGGTAPVAAQLQRSPAGAGEWADVPGATASPATDSGLTPATSYEYRVTWTDSGEEPQVATSNVVAITTDSPDPDPDPLAPGVLSTTGQTQTTATLAWTDPTGGVPPVAASLQRSPAGSGSWTDVGTASPHVDSGLSPATAYEYRVVWADAGEPADTATSNVVALTTDAPAPDPDPVPGVEPVGLDEFKAHRRVSGGDEDGLITLLIAAARRQVEADTGRTLAARSWDWRLDDWPSAPAWLPGPPSAVESITYLDAGGVTRTLDPAVYRVVGTDPARLRLAPGRRWPTALRGPGAVTVHLSGGYAPGAVPETLRLAILMLAGHWFENREAAIEPAVGNGPIEVPLAYRLLIASEDPGIYR